MPRVKMTVFSVFCLLWQPGMPRFRIAPTPGRRNAVTHINYQTLTSRLSDGTWEFRCDQEGIAVTADTADLADWRGFHLLLGATIQHCQRCF